MESEEVDSSMSENNRTALCFSGQGAQKVGMFKNLFDSTEGVKEIFDVASYMCGFDVAKVCFEGPGEQLNQTIYTQPCVLACDIAAGEALGKRGFEYDYVAGFSLGEYAALYLAGCITLEDVFKLIRVRALAMQEAVPLGKGAMLAIMTENIECIEMLCSQQSSYVQIANYNSLSQIVVAGEIEGINAIESELKRKEIKCTKLRVSVPFHCVLMESAKEKLEEAFKEVSFRKPNIPIVMNFDGKAETNIEIIKEKILLQTMNAVRWVDSVIYMKKKGVNLFVECGPGNTLSKFIKNIAPEVETVYVNDSISLNKVLKGSI